MLLTGARSPSERYSISSSVHTDFDNEEGVGHHLPAATPSNIHHCWLNSRQLPIGRVSSLYPATSAYIQPEYNTLGLRNACWNCTKVHRVSMLRVTRERVRGGVRGLWGELRMLSQNKARLKRTFTFTSLDYQLKWQKEKYMCVSGCVRGYCEAP